MFKLLKNLKPFAWTIIIIFGLLFAQAMTELSLPDYMSRIVNIGIQQNGIQNAVPEAIRAVEMQKITLFLSDSDREFVDNCYLLLDKNILTEEEYTRYLKSYPALAEEAIYRLNTGKRTEIERLNNILGGPIIVVDMLEKNALPATAGFSLPEGVDPFLFFAQLPSETKAKVLEMLRSQFAALPQSNIVQMATTYITTEYKTIGLDVNHLQTQYIMKTGILMLGLSLAGAICSITVGYLASWVAAAFGRDTRRRLFTKVLGFSNVELDRFSTASLITRSTNDVMQIQMMLVMLLRMVFYAPIIGIGAIIKVTSADISLSWTIIVAVGVILTVIILQFLIAVPKFKLVQKLVDRLNLVSREMLSGIMVIRAFNTQKYEEKRFDEANIDLANVNLFLNRIMVLMMPVMMLVMNGTMLLIIWFGAKQIDAGNMQVGSMMAYMQYAMQIIMSFMMVSMVFIMLPRASVSAQRISQVLETDPVIVDPPVPKSFPEHTRGVIEFRNVGFKYPGADDYVLKDISFIARPGETTAIVGSTGSGKSTLINLIPRFYDVTEGQILIDGVDIREVRLQDLRAKIGYIPQKNILFSGTIESNIKYGNNDANEDDVIKATVVAQALDIINSSRDGLKTEIAQSGTNLSGGQRQRLSIARALVRKPEIYIFDDSFSAVDFRTDAALRRALKQETAGATVLIVAQRIGTIMNADQIIVLEKGRIAGIGKHRELMNTCEVYRELALSQLSREELA